MTGIVEPSMVIKGLIQRLEQNGFTVGMETMAEREAEFNSPLEATLTGIALDPLARGVAKQYLDEYWSNVDVRRTLGSHPTDGEIIIGSGFHAAVYAATRVRMGFPKPLVLEADSRVGGTFARAGRPTFYLNSRNRPGGPGIAGDINSSLNHLPGGIVQATNVSMAEYPTDDDMAFVVRATLAQYATVVPGVTVTDIDSDEDGNALEVAGYGQTLFGGRIISARGLGNSSTPDGERPSPYLMSFNEFRQHLANPWPMRGLLRVAVVGDGDSAKCAVEAFLGQGPLPYMACSALDYVERIDWYGPGLPIDCSDWARSQRGRYQAIGRHLRADQFGVSRLNVFNNNAYPVALSDSAVIDGRSYDLVVRCIGNDRTPLGPFGLASYITGGQQVALYNGNGLFVVGPNADLPFAASERERYVLATENNRASMFRLGTKTAMLAATLPAPEADDDDDDNNPF